MTNIEFQQYLKQFPDNAIITAIIPTITEIDIGKYFCEEEGITPLTIENIEYNDCKNYILIFQE